MPKISIIMPVYNAERYLDEAVKSILIQTYTNFEFIIIDDASSDGSFEKLKSVADPRIILIRNENNLGITKTLNKGLGIARGTYIARMDSDDVAMPIRLERQFEFMEKNPGVGVVGSFAKSIDENGNEIGFINLPINNVDIKSCLFAVNKMIHPSVMIRKKVLTDNNIKYDESFRSSQDYKLWIDLMDKTCFYNIPEVLLKYRVLDSGITKRVNKNIEYKSAILKRIHNDILEKNDINLSESDMDIYTLCVIRLKRLSANSQDVLRIIKSVIQDCPKIYNKRKLTLLLSGIWVWHNKLKTWNRNSFKLNIYGIVYYLKRILGSLFYTGLKHVYKKIKLELLKS